MAKRKGILTSETRKEFGMTLVKEQNLYNLRELLLNMTKKDQDRFTMNNLAAHRRENPKSKIRFNSLCELAYIAGINTDDRPIYDTFFSKIVDLRNTQYIEKNFADSDKIRAFVFSASWYTKPCKGANTAIPVMEAIARISLVLLDLIPDDFHTYNKSYIRRKEVQEYLSKKGK